MPTDRRNTILVPGVEGVVEVTPRSELDTYECRCGRRDCDQDGVAAKCGTCGGREFIVWYSKSQGVICLACPECNAVTTAYRIAADH